MKRTAPSGAAIRHLTDANRQEIRRAYWKGDTQVFLAKAWDVSQSTISRVVAVLDVYPDNRALTRDQGIDRPRGSAPG